MLLRSVLHGVVFFEDCASPGSLRKLVSCLSVQMAALDRFITSEAPERQTNIDEKGKQYKVRFSQM
jgi:hypothetical protein